MADILKPSILRMTAVYWAPLGAGDDGQRLYNTPIELKKGPGTHGVRWTEEAVQPQVGAGREVKNQSVVLVPIDMKTGGALRLGPISDITDLSANPFSTYDEVWEIKEFRKIPNKRCSKFLRKAYL